MILLQGMQLPCCFFQHLCNAKTLILVNKILVYHFKRFENGTQSLNFFYVSRLTFYRIIRKKSTEEFSCVPYIIALLNCLLYTWYGLPVVSYRWENFPVVTINGLGILLEFSFIFIYFWFTSARGKASYLNFICQTIAEMFFLACLNYQC